MGIDPVSLAIGGGLAAASAAAQASAASSQNRQISRQMRSNNAAVGAEINQRAAAAALERKKIDQEAARIRGMVFVNAAERGVGVGGSASALARQADLDAQANRDVVATNLFNSEQRLRSGLDVTNRQLQAQSSNAFLSGLTGATQGLTTGLSIGNGINEMFNQVTQYTGAIETAGNNYDFDKFPRRGGDGGL